jgi:hypothetical protein
VSSVARRGRSHQHGSDTWDAEDVVDRDEEPDDEAEDEPDGEAWRGAGEQVLGTEDASGDDADEGGADGWDADEAGADGWDDDEAGADEWDDEGERTLWCETCQCNVPLGDLDDDECCPTCGEPLGRRSMPWKFRLMIAASVIYLGYRAYQGVTWVVHHV